MDAEISRILHAVHVASSPLNQDKSLQVEAVNYLAEVQQNAYQDQVWALALTLFVDTSTDPLKRKYDPQTRLFALRILDEFLDNRSTPLDDASFTTLKTSFMAYIESEYIRGSAESSATFLRNKFSHTFTLFFLCTYQNQWRSFFPHLFSLIRISESSGTTSTSLFPPNLNIHISLLFFRIVLEISGEISDQILKSARGFYPERHSRDARIRDLVRERDAAGLNAAVVGIISECLSKLQELRPKYLEFKRVVDALDEVVDWGIKAFCSYIHWIDISLTCSPNTIQMMFSLLSANPHTSGAFPVPLSIRLGTVSALQRMIAKGLKEPSDKLDLLRVLDLGKVLHALELQTRESRSKLPPDISEDEEQFRESLGRLLSTLGQEILELSKEEINEQTRLPAVQLLDEIFPVTLRFLGDEYDDTSATTFPFIHGLLMSYKRSKKSNQNASLGESKQTFLRHLIEVLLEKLKWGSDDDPYDMDDDDKSQFETFRKDIKTFLEAINAIEPDMIVSSLCSFAMNILNLYEAKSPVLTWQLLELAVYVILIFGEVNKGPSKGRAAFCVVPPASPTASRQEAKQRRDETDYGRCPLTPQGQLMVTLIKSDVLGFSHSNSIVAMQVFEVAVRYPDFFKVRKACAAPILEAMVDERGIHNTNSAVRSRAFYLLYRFIKEQRNDVSPELATALLSRVADTLAVDSTLSDEAEVSSDAGFSDVVTELASHATSFDSQAYMFEAVGILLSLLWEAAETQHTAFRNLVGPILEEMQQEIHVGRSAVVPDPRDTNAVLAVVKLQRNIISLGQIAKGFPDFPQSPPPGYVIPPIPIFQQCVEAIMISLDAMSRFKIIREAARSSFAKIVAPTGLHITPYIPEFMRRLIVHSETSELTEFINFISLLVHRLQDQMFPVLDELQGPLYQHITTSLSGPATEAGVEGRRAYLHLLNVLMSSSLDTVFTSERNMPHLEPLLEFVMQMASDVTDPQSQKSAFTFLGRCVAAWAPLVPESGRSTAPGLERFIYDHLVPLIFKVPSMPEFNVKDAQMIPVCYEIASTLQTVCKIRGQEAYDYLSTVFFPGVQCPPETAEIFLNQLQELDSKGFRKYFTDFVRASKVA